jgi:hypothetical protein
MGVLTARRVVVRWFFTFKGAVSGWDVRVKTEVMTQFSQAYVNNE